MKGSNPFYGATYAYPTPNDSYQEIGVTGPVLGQWFVAWIRGKVFVRVRTDNLPASEDPDVLQAKLDEWAAKRNLRKHEAW